MIDNPFEIGWIVLWDEEDIEHVFGDRCRSNDRVDIDRSAKILVNGRRCVVH